MTELPKGALIVLLESDGITLPGRGEERSIKCFNPYHHDDTPSMRVNVVREVYRCYLCDISGNAWTYLTKIRGYTEANATEILKNLGWTPGTFRHAKNQAQKAQEASSGQARLVAMPPDVVGGKEGVPRAKCIAQHEYRRADGQLICVRYRYEKIHKLIPRVRTFTPASNGDWWCAEPYDTSVPSEDRHDGELPLYRLPGLLEAIEGNDRKIWIVKGENKVDAILQQRPPEDGLPPVTCLYDGLDGKPTRHDLSPLAGRELLLIADPRAGSHRNMTSLEEFLRSHHDCRARRCLPDGSGGLTIAHAVYGHQQYSGGISGAREWLSKHCEFRCHAALGWKPLRVLLTRQLPFALVEQGTFSLLEALRVCIAPHSRKDEWAGSCDEFLRMHGVIWYRKEGLILFAHASSALRQVLDGTEFRTVALSGYLKNLPGVTKPKSRPRLVGGRQPSYVGLTPWRLRRNGFTIGTP